MQKYKNEPKEIKLSNKNYYLAIWNGLFKELLGWSEMQVLEWAKTTGKLEALDDPDNIFYHENPIYWATYTLIPDVLKKDETIDIVELEQSILVAFKNKYYYNFPENTDWRPYRAKIEQILGEYGEHLPGHSA